MIQYLLSCKKNLKLNKNSTYVTTEYKVSGNKTPEYKMAEYKNLEEKSLKT